MLRECLHCLSSSKNCVPRTYRTCAPHSVLLKWFVEPRFLLSRGQQTLVHGPSQPSACFSVAFELVVVITLFKVWEEIKRSIAFRDL